MFISNTYPGRRLVAACCVLLIAFIISFFIPIVYGFAFVGLLVGVVALLFDLISLHAYNIEIERTMADRFDLGESNPITFSIGNRAPVPLHIEIRDESPVQFQIRDSVVTGLVASGQKQEYSYGVSPTIRGEYIFGWTHVFVESGIGLVSVRKQRKKRKKVRVYPSVTQMIKWDTLAVSNDLTRTGVHLRKKRGQSTEFDSIREYVIGDDIRHINWKASARHSNLMVNLYQDETDQDVVCVIDSGRNMKLPFSGMSLLDHAVNSTLVISNVVLKQGDNVGVYALGDEEDGTLKPTKRVGQLQRVMETLYNLKYKYRETSMQDFAILQRRHLKRRSILMLYTNFESEVSARRQLPYLRMIARNHVLIVVLFKNEEVEAIATAKYNSVVDNYQQLLARRYMEEKHRIVQELKASGIFAVLTTTGNLNSDVINSYLEVKHNHLL